jgi:hypothetical protein
VKVTLVREIVETAYSGDHSTQTTQTCEADIVFLTPDSQEPKLRNPGYMMASDWKIVSLTRAKAK